MKVIQCTKSNKIFTIEIKEGSPVKDIISQILERASMLPHEARIIHYTMELNNCSTGTLEDYEIEDFTSLYVITRYLGGGNPTHLYSYFDDCSMKEQCRFHDLFQWGDIYELSQQQQNAYNLLCRKFNFSHEVIRAIDDNHEVKGIRLADVLH